MNKERLLELADTIEKDHYKFNGLHTLFDMTGYFRADSSGVTDSESIAVLESLRFKEVYIDPISREGIEEVKHMCNSTACIAGFACLLYDYENASNLQDSYQYHNKAAKILGLDYHQAKYLFQGAISSLITGAEAATVIRHLVETGEVNWSIVLVPRL